MFITYYGTGLLYIIVATYAKGRTYEIPVLKLKIALLPAIRKQRISETRFLSIKRRVSLITNRYRY